MEATEPQRTLMTKVNEDQLPCSFLYQKFAIKRIKFPNKHGVRFLNLKVFWCEATYWELESHGQLLRLEVSEAAVPSRVWTHASWWLLVCVVRLCCGLGGVCSLIHGSSEDCSLPRFTDEKNGIDDSHQADCFHSLGT